MQTDSLCGEFTKPTVEPRYAFLTAKSHDEFFDNDLHSLLNPTAESSLPQARGGLSIDKPMVQIMCGLAGLHKQQVLAGGSHQEPEEG